MTPGHTSTEWAATRALSIVAGSVTVASTVGFLLAILMGLASQLPPGSPLLPIVALVVQLAGQLGYTASRTLVKRAEAGA